jgi:hypothetical protein
MIKGAVISRDGVFRYALWRYWGTGRRIVCFVMLNPSTGDASLDDPTIRRCISFAQLWGYDGLVIVNLHAFRSSEPKDLRLAVDSIGPLNRFFVGIAVNEAELIICAWGNHGAYQAQDAEMLTWLRRFKLSALRISRDGFPGHPLYIERDAKILQFPS